MSIIFDWFFYTEYTWDVLREFYYILKLIIDWLGVIITDLSCNINIVSIHYITDITRIVPYYTTFY